MGWGSSKIGRRIVALVLLSVTISMVTVTAIFMWMHLNERVDSRRAEIESAGLVFASAIADHVAAGDGAEALKALRSITRMPGIAYAVALDKDRREIAALGSSVVDPAGLAARDDGLITMLTRGAFPVSVGIVKAGEPAGSLMIVADVTDLRKKLAGGLLVTLLAAIFACFAGLLAATRLQKRITAPIVTLTAAMERIRKARDYSQAVDHKADDETGVLVGTFNCMIAEIGSRDRALERMAYYDALTGIGNRQMFREALDRTLKDTAAGKAGSGLFLFDLDGFKLVNDTFGHSFGDALLRSVAGRLGDEFEGRAQLARLGGDEFAMIAAGLATESEAETLAARAMASLVQPVLVDKHEIFVSTSIGIAMIPRDGSTAEEVLRRADLALYSAKRDGPGRVKFYRPALDEDVQRRTELARDLRQALEDGVLEAHYQPQVDLAAGAVAGFESLLRWKHPLRGYIPPAVFVPIAEESGLICAMGLWILRESCRQSKAWIDAGHPPRQISVNVSMAQIQQTEFHLDVLGILSETGLPAELLCLELTESLFIGNSRRRVSYILQALKQTGVTLAIDDFGTGYSSLSYLQELPFDKLKIDRAFISGVDKDAGKRRLLKGIVELGHALGKSLVAEGAETEGEVAVLRQMRADQVQGYVFSRPVPAIDAIAAAETVAQGFEERYALALAMPAHMTLQQAG